MIYIVHYSDLECEIDRRETSEATLDADMKAFVADSMFAIGDTIRIVEAN